MQIRSSHIIINEQDGIIMGPGRMAILESLDRTRSINQTAKELNMSYKTAWSKIKTTEKNYGSPVIVSDRRSGTRLTREGKRLLEKYRQLKERCIQADDSIFEDIFQD